ncbi:MAG: hypothetical protein EAY75_14235 [Bacteroidetes bacterium]|nr:MAG: hypothetical protein EAY75_14235 [Bacteroidota bacterium]
MVKVHPAALALTLMLPTSKKAQPATLSQYDDCANPFRFFKEPISLKIVAHFLLVRTPFYHPVPTLCVAIDHFSVVKNNPLPPYISKSPSKKTPQPPQLIAKACPFKPTFATY